MTVQKYFCPACRKKHGVDILYGMPTGQTFEMAERGDIVLGGCCLLIDAPERECTSCGHQWRISRREKKFD